MARTLRVLCLSAAVLLMGCGSVTASTPNLLWLDAKKVVVLCLVAPNRLIDRATLEAEVCRRVVAKASGDSPLPITAIAHGDPQVIASDTVALLVHASVQPDSRDGALVAFSIRPFRATAEQSAQLFSAPPRAAAVRRDLTGLTVLDGAVDAALSEILPWRAGTTPSGPQPL